MIMQSLARHSSRPIPPAVIDLLQRWASKRERITMFSSAVLVEFATPAELDAAIGRGIVAVRLNDRIGMTADGNEPGLNQLRLIANRDYEARPLQCVQVEGDGVTLTIDVAAADLLLDAEIVRFSEALPSEQLAPRRYRLNGELLRRAAESLPLTDIDAWFIDRTGQPLSPAGHLFLVGPQAPPPVAVRLLAVHSPRLNLPMASCNGLRPASSSRSGSAQLSLQWGKRTSSVFAACCRRWESESCDAPQWPNRLPFCRFLRQYPRRASTSVRASRWPRASTVSAVSPF